MWIVMRLQTKLELEPSAGLPFPTEVKMAPMTPTARSSRYRRYQND